MRPERRFGRDARCVWHSGISLSRGGAEAETAPATSTDTSTLSTNELAVRDLWSRWPGALVGIPVRARVLVSVHPVDRLRRDEAQSEEIDQNE